MGILRHLFPNLFPQIDDIHSAHLPVFAGEGEHSFPEINLPQFCFTSMETVARENATHLLIPRGRLRYTSQILMWRVGFCLFLAMFATSFLTNAVAVYLLHDVDADRAGRLTAAYWGLMLEFLFFAVVVTAIMLLVSWIGSLVLNLRLVDSSRRLSFVLGAAVILIQYPAEFAVRMLSPQRSDSFLFGYLLLAPMACAVVLLLDAKRRRTAD